MKHNYLWHHIFDALFHSQTQTSNCKKDAQTLNHKLMIFHIFAKMYMWTRDWHKCFEIQKIKSKSTQNVRGPPCFNDALSYCIFWTNENNSMKQGLAQVLWDTNQQKPKHPKCQRASMFQICFVILYFLNKSKQFCESGTDTSALKHQNTKAKAPKMSEGHYAKQSFQI